MTLPMALSSLLFKALLVKAGAACASGACPASTSAPRAQRSPFSAQEHLLLQMTPGHVERAAVSAEPRREAAPDHSGLLQTSPSTEDVLQAVLRTQEMLAVLEEQVASMTSCCNCSGGGGGDKNGRGFRTPSTTKPNGPVSAGGAPTTTTTSTTTEPAYGLCAAFGDPHFITFDGGHTVLVGERTLWLVRTENVWLQALSKGSDGKLSGVAAGGKFLKGHSLVIYNETSSGLRVVFDGRPILNGTEDEFVEPEVLEAHRTAEWDVAIHDDRVLQLRTEAKFDIGDWHERFLGRPRGGLFLFKLPDSVEVTVTGVDFMSVVITMPRPAEGSALQGGYCGNYNGIPEDDAKPVVPSWNVPLGTDLGMVGRSLDLFRGKSAPASLLARTDQPEVSEIKALETRLQAVARCPEALRRQAEERCGRVEDARMKRDCIFDICLTGDLRAGEEALTAEVLQDTVGARGVPAFMGYGQCLDAHGRAFTSIGTNVRTERECQDLLRGQALTKGVLGAQLRRGSTCQLLVDQSLDPTAVKIPGGWSTSGEGAAEPFAWGPGQGLVRGSSEDPAWSCWQLD